MLLHFQGQSTSAQYADLAERFAADTHIEPGTIVALGGAEEITRVNDELSNKVFGVVSTAPAYLMNSGAGNNASHPAVAVSGRVPCKVIGITAKGDMLVASAVPGYAVVNNNPKPGTIIGKALENKPDGGKSTIEIIVGKV